MSASVYANPYTYKPPPPRIKYPMLFSSFNNITFRYMVDSKILALSVIITSVATFVILILTLLPFWFQLVLDPIDGTFGSKAVMTKVTINTGLFYMRETEFDNTVFLDKYTNTDTVPKAIQAAQTFSIAGTCLLVGCMSASIILALRRFASVTALMMLAGATTLAAVLHVLVILACAVVLTESSCDPYDGSGCNYKDNLEWHMIPMYSQVYRPEPTLTPYVKANWAFYIAIIGAVLAVASAVMVWIEAFMNCKNLRQIRYQQMKEHRDPYEKEADPYTGSKYVYRPPVQPGPNTFGMQPVMMSGHNYEGMVINAPQFQGYIPPPTFAPARPPSPGFAPVRPPSPGFGSRYAPPSVTSSTSGPNVLQEIDL